jgi:hypothetical protein
VSYKSRYITEGFNKFRCWLKRKLWDLRGDGDFSALPSGTVEYNLEETSGKKGESAALVNFAILAVHPSAFEPGTRQHIWRGGSLPRGYSWQQS